jgi:membrane protein required for colicin V production
MIFDIICLLFFLFAMFRGYQQGLIRSLFTFTGSFIALVTAVLFSGYLKTLVSDTMHYDGRWLPALAFLIVFIAVIFLVKLLANMVESFAEIAMLGWFNKLAGLSVYLLLSILFLSAMIYFINIVGSDLRSFVQPGYFYEILKPIVPSLFVFISEYCPSFGKTITAFDNVVQ